MADIQVQVKQQPLHLVLGIRSPMPRKSPVRDSETLFIPCAPVLLSTCSPSPCSSVLYPLVLLPDLARTRHPNCEYLELVIHSAHAARYISEYFGRSLVRRYPYIYTGYT